MGELVLGTEECWTKETVAMIDFSGHAANLEENAGIPPKVVYSRLPGKVRC